MRKGSHRAAFRQSYLHSKVRYPLRELWNNIIRIDIVKWSEKLDWCRNQGCDWPSALSSTRRESQQQRHVPFRLGRTTFCPTSKKPGILAAVSNLPLRSRKICFFVNNFSDWLLPPAIIIWLWETLTAELLMGEDTQADTHDTAQTKTAVRKIILSSDRNTKDISSLCCSSCDCCRYRWIVAAEESTNRHPWRTWALNIKTKKSTEFLFWNLCGSPKWRFWESLHFNFTVSDQLFWLWRTIFKNIPFLVLQTCCACVFVLTRF